MLLVDLLINDDGGAHIEHLLHFSCLVRRLLLLLVVIDSVKQVGVVHLVLRWWVLALS
jgi:hypothetical protein